MRWGADEITSSRHTLRDEAAAAGLWVGDSGGDYVDVTGCDLGLTVIDGGNVINPSDWTGEANPDCF